MINCCDNTAVSRLQGRLGGNKNWVDTTRAAIAENILNLTRLSKEDRSMDRCIKNPVLWLALAAHCVLHPEHAERLSSGQWLKPEKSKPAPPRVSIINYRAPCIKKKKKKIVPNFGPCCFKVHANNFPAENFPSWFPHNSTVLFLCSAAVYESRRRRDGSRDPVPQLR